MIYHFLEHSADRRPEDLAVIHGTKRFNYGQVDAWANQVANWMIKRGVKPGERIALLCRNSIEYIIFYYSILKAGAVAVPLNTGLDKETLSNMILDCSVTGVLTESKFSTLINDFSIQAQLDLRFVVTEKKQDDHFDKSIPVIPLTDVLSLSPRHRPNLSCHENDIASIIYTSGSTGTPKGVVLSHKNIIENTRSIISYLNLNRRDRILVILPLYYVYGKTLLNTHFAVSGVVIIDNNFTFPNAILNSMIKHRATGFAGVPSSYSILLDRSKIRTLDFPELRYVTQAGGHMPAEVKKKLIKALPGKDVVIMYGATEASARLAYLAPEELVQHLSSIGKPIPNVTMKVVDGAGEELPCGEEGEIVASGPNIMQGYWNAPQETRRVLKNEWYHTGDLGWQDTDGFFYVSGRKRDMIKVGIHKVSAREVEEVLHNIPGVLEAAVLGVFDSLTGEALHAYVVPLSGSQIDPEDVIYHCEIELLSYKRPKKIFVIEGLPKNESGKVMKRALHSRPSHDENITV